MSENDPHQHDLHGRERITIRDMELDDLPPVFHLGEQLFTADLWPNLYRTWDEYELVGFFSSEREYCLVAEQGDRIVGFTLGSLLEKRRGAWVYGYLVWLGVAPDVARSGIGARLVRRLTDRFIEDGARMLLVDTDAHNERAIRFFKKQGFGQEMDHLYMTMNLTHHPEYKRRRERERPRHREEGHRPHDTDKGERG